MSSSIVVALDGEPAAEQALTPAALLAKRLGATLRVVHVHGPVIGPAVAPPGQTYLDRVLGDVAREHGIAAEAVLLEGNARTELLDYVTTHPIRLTVLATNPKRLLDRVLQGSVAESLIRHDGPPVLLVRPGPHARTAPLYREILIPVDGSEHSASIIDVLLDLHLAQDIRCTLLHVRTMMVASIAAASRLGDVDAYLRDVGARLQRAGADVTIAAVQGVSAVPGILDFARANPVPLIAMATHGWSGLASVILGSTAQQIVRNAEADLLLHRPRQLND